MDMQRKPHAVCIPYPSQGSINPLLKLAKLLHYKGFHITFVNTEYNHKRLLKSRGGPESLKGLPSFRFETIPDGLPPTDDDDVTQDTEALCESIMTNFNAPFKELLARLNDDASSPPVSCIVSEGLMTFALEAAEEIGVPEVMFWTVSACGFLAFMHFFRLIENGVIPLKDESYLANGYLDTKLDLPGMEGIKLKDMPNFVRTTNPDDIMLKFVLQFTEGAKKSSAIVLNTFEEIDHQVLQPLSQILPRIYTIGPLHFLENQIHDQSLKAIASNLWKEDSKCLEWLDSKQPNSVVYVNFGSITVMTRSQLEEFAWGLANSNQTFLWIIRPDLISGDSDVLPPEFIEVTKERCLITSWCPQPKVLNHPSIGGFLTHCGWNSTLEAICSGVPLLCWPFYADQQPNCWFSCNKWGIGMEINCDVKRHEVERVVRELMIGENGKEMKKNAMEWKKKAEEAIGSSHTNLNKMIDQVLLASRY